MAFYIMHDTFISQKQQHSELRNRKSYGSKNVNNDEKRLNHFERKLLLKNFDYESRHTNELVKNNEKEISDKAKETKNTTLRNRKEESEDESFDKNHKLKEDKVNYLPLPANIQLGNSKKIHDIESKNIEESDENCEKEKALVNDLNINEKKEDTSKDLIKCSAQEDIQGTQLAILNVESCNTDHNNNIQVKQETEENLIKTTNKELNEYKTVQTDIEQHVVEYVETCYITRKKGDNGERQQIHLKQTEDDKTEELKSEYEEEIEAEDEFEGKGVKVYEIKTDKEEEYQVKTEADKKYEETRKVDTECGKPEYGETGELKQEIEEALYYKEREGEEIEYKETEEVETKYEETEVIKTVYQVELELDDDKMGEVETEYEEIGYKKTEVDTEDKETGKLEEVTVELEKDYEDMGQVETDYHERVVIDIEDKEMEKVDTEYKERRELEEESEEMEEVATEYKENVEKEYERKEKVEIGNKETVNLQTEDSKTEEVETNLITDVTDICSSIDEHIKNRESEEKLILKSKKNELISQQNVKQKVIEREYEIYKALIIPHKTKEINVEDKFVAKLKGIEATEKKIGAGNDAKHTKEEITKLGNQDVNRHKSLKLTATGAHELPPSREERQLYWIFLAVSWLPVLLLLSLALSYLQMLADLHNS